MFVRVLGSAAGGGFPQWNCGCDNCEGVRRGTLRGTARTQESVAISADRQRFFLLNASPEIRQQIESYPALHPRLLRDTPIAGIVLTSGDLDHCLGLLSLRESQRLAVYSTERVRKGFMDENAFARTLERFPGQLTWRVLRLGVTEPLRDPDGSPSGLSLTAFAVPGKAPLHAASAEHDREDNVALRIVDERAGKVLAYASGVAAPSPGLESVVAAADAVLFDGTFWSDDELTRIGASTRTARDMAHWPVGGEGGSLQYLRGLTARRRVLIHVNNSNPLLRDDSAERETLHAAGVELAHDGMELVL